jgi:hypothetical protein
MADYNVKLSQLHQRVVQAELQVLATIDEYGSVGFKDPDLGELRIALREYSPEFMMLECVVFEDHKGTRPREDLVRACITVNNSLNCSQTLARLMISDTYNVVRASVALVLPVLGRTAMYALPDEAFLRSVIVRAVSSIKDAAKEYADELQKLNSTPTA